MKLSILLLALISVIALGSCTTAYKTGQTPDDVYYSPARPQDEYVYTEKRDNRYYSSDDYYDDRYLRMKVRDRYRWNDLDDWYYYGGRRYNNYAYFPSIGFYSNPWTPYSYWNCTYNPYYSGVIIVKAKSPTYSKPRTFNLNTYNNNALTNKSYSTPKARTSVSPYSDSRPRTSSSSSNSGGSKGGILRNIFNGGNNDNSSSGSRSSSSGSSSSSSGSSRSSSSGSSGGSAPVRKF